MLLMGSEQQGLPPVLESVVDTMGRIPMAGSVDSLNLAVVTALVLYEARNQRYRACIISPPARGKPDVRP